MQPQIENYTEKCGIIRKQTLAPMKDIAAALIASNGDVKAAVDRLVALKATSVEDMANRRADNKIVYSYVHNHKVGAMIILACQTDFVAKNELFLQLAKDICMHICSTPVPPRYIGQKPTTLKGRGLPLTERDDWRFDYRLSIEC
jgi:elongation factor Ts